MDEELEALINKVGMVINNNESCKAMTDSLLEMIILISKEKTFEVFRVCDKIFQELLSNIKGGNEETFLSFSKRVIIYTNSINENDEVSVYALPNSINGKNEEEKKNIQSLFEFYSNKINMQYSAIAFQEEILKNKYKVLETLKPMKFSNKYIAYKLKNKLMKQLSHTIEANNKYFTLNEKSHKEVILQVENGSKNSEKLLIEFNRFTEKIINLNEEILKRLEKYLQKQQNIEKDYQKIIFAKEQELNIKEIELMNEIKSFDNEIVEFNKETAKFEKQNRSFLYRKDTVSYMFIYILLGISIGFLLRLINPLSFTSSEYF